MSRKELKKWENKFRLWHKLHPKQGFHRCMYCNYFKQYKGQGPSCPTHLLIDRRGEKHLIEVDTVTEEVLNSDVCIEWIKDA